MIKFKKIIQRAAGPAVGGSVARLLTATKASRPAAKVGTAQAEPPLSPPQRYVPAQEKQDEADYAVDDRVAASVLEDIFQGSPAAQEPPPESREEREALLSDLPPAAPEIEGSVAAEGVAADETSEGEVESQATPEDVNDFYESAPQPAPEETVAIESMIDEAISSITAEEVVAESAPPDETEPAQHEQAEPVTSAPEQTVADQSPPPQEEAPTPESAPSAVEEKPAGAERPQEETVPIAAPEDFTAESVMSEVDRLLAQLGQITMPEASAKAAAKAPGPAPLPQEDKPFESAAAVGASADQARGLPDAAQAAATQPAAAGPDDEISDAGWTDEISQLAALTAEEKEALFSNEALEVPGGSDGNLLETVSAEVEQAAESVSAKTEAAPGGSAEVEIDFSAEAVGIEESPEAHPAEVSDVDDLLSSLMSEMENLGPPTAEAQKAPAKKPAAADDSTMSKLLGAEGKAQPEGQPVATPQPPAERPKPVAPPPPKPGAENAPHDDSAEARQLAEEDLITQALQEALGEEFGEDDQEEGIAESFFDDESDDTDEEDDSPSADDVPEDKESRPPAAPPDGAKSEGEGSGEPSAADDLLAHLEASFEKARPAGDAASSRPPDDEETRIQQEVLSRSRGVEQSLLEELFGDGTSGDEQVPEPPSEEAESEDDSQAETADASAAQEADQSPATQEDEVDDSQAKEAKLLPPRLRLGLLWFAYQLNRPFLRWMTPSVRRHLALVSIGLVSSGMISLAVALALLLKGR